MKEKDDRQPTRVCPDCGSEYRARPATSRRDGQPICPECGIREALASIGVLDRDEQSRILEKIRNAKT